MLQILENSKIDSKLKKNSFWPSHRAKSFSKRRYQRLRSVDKKLAL